MEVIGLIFAVCLIVGLPIGFIYVIVKSVCGDSIITKHNLCTGIFCVLGFFIIFVTIAATLSNYNNRHDTHVAHADGFTVEEFKLDLVVDEYGMVDVAEDITVNFFESGKHGIYRTIPTWLPYVGKDGTKVSREAIVEDVKVIDDKYTKEMESSKLKLRIGDPNITFSTGTKTYKIRYKYNMGNDPFENYDEFIFHAFGDHWGTQIKNASITLTMPKDIQEDKVHFFADKNRNAEINSNIEYRIEGNKLYAKVKDDYSLYKALTIDLELPDNYFNKTEDQYGIKSMALCILIIALATLSIINWFTNGRDLKVKVEQNITSPPENYDPAMIGYIYKRGYGSKLTIALILELAAKGYIKIDEEQEENEIIVTRLLNADEQGNPPLSKNERIIYDYLFADGEVNKISKDENIHRSFYDLSINIKKEYDESIYDIKSFKIMSYTAASFLLSCISFFAAYCVVEDLNPKFSILYLIAFISLFVIFFFTIWMKRKTYYGQELEEKVFSFKTYIESIKEDDLKNDSMYDSKYFYSILPYALVLGISKEWIDKYTNIKKIDEALGNFQYYDYTSYDRFNNILPSSSGGSSSSSSGCSSCGGGCSSCGGGGSW